MKAISGSTGSLVLSQLEKFNINRFTEMTPRCLPWCHCKFLLGVYFLCCSHFDWKIYKKRKEKKSPITATDWLLTKTICLCNLNTQSQSSLGPNSLFKFFLFFLFSHGSIYLNLRCVFVVLLHSCHSHWFVIICAAVESCYWWCVCVFCESASLLLSDLTRQHQLSGKQRRKSKCECVEGDRDHY